MAHEYLEGLAERCEGELPGMIRAPCSLHQNP